MTMGIARRAVSEVGDGYRATWELIRRSGRHPFGEASSSHRWWLLFPQMFVIGGASGAFGSAINTEWVNLVWTTLICAAGLAIVAWVGRAYRRGTYGTE